MADMLSGQRTDAGSVTRFAGHCAVMGSNLLAAMTSHDVSLLFVLLALICFAGAAYMAYLRNVVGAVLLVFVAVVVLLFGA